MPLPILSSQCSCWQLLAYFNRQPSCSGLLHITVVVLTMVTAVRQILAAVDCRDRLVAAGTLEPVLRSDYQRLLD